MYIDPKHLRTSRPFDMNRYRPYRRPEPSPVSTAGIRTSRGVKAPTV